MSGFTNIIPKSITIRKKLCPSFTVLVTVRQYDLSVGHPRRFSRKRTNVTYNQGSRRRRGVPTTTVPTYLCRKRKGTDDLSFMSCSAQEG